MASRSRVSDRLSSLRKRMRSEGIDLLLVRSTDEHLNEYVPTEMSDRVWISGFTGSTGEVLITEAEAFLAVDGRYWLQAEKEVEPSLFQVIRVPFGTSIDQSLLAQMERIVTERPGGPAPVVGYDSACLSVATLDFFRETLCKTTMFRPLQTSLVKAVRGLRAAKTDPKIRVVDDASVGVSVVDKLSRLAAELGEGFDGFAVQKLDEIAYLSNLRGEELPYQATFRAKGFATSNTLVLGLDTTQVPSAIRNQQSSLCFVDEQAFWEQLGKNANCGRIAYDPRQTSEETRLRIEQAGAEAVPVSSPIERMKAKKTSEEQRAMKAAFRRADCVVYEAMAWLCREVVAKKQISEFDFAQQVRALFLDAGARGLSFKVISAAGKNAALIHYSDPSRTRMIERGELLLLDTGAYFDEGYATDLTRTFLVDKPEAQGTPEMQRYYTLVLKAAMAGMRAIVPVDTRGAQLDALVRAPLWAHGFDYPHGTGHGVGINVHEFPPRVGPQSVSRLEPGHVFSIEPGLYLRDFGGVRIENICTTTRLAHQPDFLKVEPLTFCPLDERLIDRNLLDAEEKAWLATYQEMSSINVQEARQNRMNPC